MNCISAKKQRGYIFLSSNTNSRPKLWEIRYTSAPLKYCNVNKYCQNLPLNFHDGSQSSQSNQSKPNQSNDLMRFHEIFLNTQIYNLSSGPHITHFLAVVAKKRENFEHTFVLKRANIACRQKVTTVNLLQKLLNNFCNTQLQIGIIS